MTRRCPLVFVATAIALLAGGCAVGPDFLAPRMQVPAAYRQPEGRSSPPVAGDARVAVDPARWWQGLGDHALDALVEQALAGSPRLEIALDRLQQVRTLEIAVTGEALPQLIAASGGGHGTGSNLARGGRTPGALHAADQSATGIAHITQDSGFNATWDIDLFGRLRRAMEAARYDAQAAAAARDAVQVALIADVVREYVDLRGLQTQIAVQRQAVDAARQLRDLVQARFDRGITNELDLTLARRQYATAQADLDPLAAQLQDVLGIIAVLVGRFPQDLDAALAKPALIPAIPARIEAGQPVELLRRRPDVRLAEWELAGATARLGVAIGNLFPDLSISGATGRQRDALINNRGSATQSIWSVGYGATLPLLDFGALDALVRVADLQAREQLLQYRQTVLDAYREVDSASAQFAAEQARLASLGEAVVAAQRATVLAGERYERGLTDFLNVVDAQRQEYELEAQYAQGQVRLGEQYVAIYRALGGGWEQFGGPPALPVPEPAIVAMFHRLVEPGGAAR